MQAIHIEIEAGKALAVIGAKASGKTTLCRLLASLPVEKDFRRAVFLNGMQLSDKVRGKNNGTPVLVDIDGAGRLIPGLSVAENIFLDRQCTDSLGRINWSQLFSETANIFAKLGIKDLLPDSQAAGLSLHQKIEVLLCQLFARNTRLYIIDEITKYISVTESAALLGAIASLKSLGASVIFIPYRIEELACFTDTVAILHRGEINGPILNFASVSYEHIINVMMGREQDDSAVAGRFISRFSATEREMEVVMYAAKGLSNEDIAERLCISVGTVKNHVYNLFQKTGVKNRVELCNLIKLQ